MRKYAIVVFLISCLSVMALTEKKEPAVVILTAGQSNADGRVSVDELPKYIKKDGYKYCLWSYGSGDYLKATGSFEPFWPVVGRKDLGHRWTFDAVVYYRLEQQLKRPFYVIKQTMGGTAIDTLCNSTNGKYWSADTGFLAHTVSASDGGRSLLKAFTEQIDDCIDYQLSKLPEGYDIKAMLWHQGESDRTQADRYYDNLKAVIAYVRNYLVVRTGQQKYAHLPVICGTFAKDSKQGSEKVVEAMLRLQCEDPNFHVVDASDATLQKDQIHFDAAGAELLGKRMYDILETL